MSYRNRTLSDSIQRVSKEFSVLLLTGPRQVGKTTLLEACAEDNRRYVTLDDLELRELAQSDPALFLQTYKPPIIIDEVQYAPQLFSAIKIIVDKAKQPGLFWLTGSQKFHLMKDITETLAGRVAILDLLGLSQAETLGQAEHVRPFLPSPPWIDYAKEYATNDRDVHSLYQKIWQGSFPKLALGEVTERGVFFNSYIQTYIQRDVRALTRVGDELAFKRLLKACAARTGQLINYADLSRDVDVDQKTAKSWISILETSGLIYLLQPYHTNVTKRLVKAPKLYFLDTGLCAYLTQWTTPEALESGAMSGAILETYLFSEILKTYWHNGQQANFYFYRDLDQKEIDLLIEQDNMFYPVEFKKTASPSLNTSKQFKVLEKLGQRIAHGGVVCLKETDVPLSREISSIPAWYL